MTDRFDGALNQRIRRGIGANDDERRVDVACDEAAVGKERGRRRVDDHPVEHVGRVLEELLQHVRCEEAGGIRRRAAAQQQLQARRHFDERHPAIGHAGQALTQRVDQSRRVLDVEDHVHGRLPQIGVDEEHVAQVGLAQGQREVRRRQRFALARAGARHHDHFGAVRDLRVVQQPRELPILLDHLRRRAVGDDELLDQILAAAAEHWRRSGRVHGRNHDGISGSGRTPA